MHSILDWVGFQVVVKVCSGSSKEGDTMISLQQQVMAIITRLVGEFPPESQRYEWFRSMVMGILGDNSHRFARPR